MRYLVSSIVICGVAAVAGGGVHAEVTITEASRLTAGPESVDPPRQVAYDGEANLLIVTTDSAAYLYKEQQLEEDSPLPAVVPGHFTVPPGGGELGTQTPSGWEWRAIDDFSAAAPPPPTAPGIEILATGYRRKITVLGEPVDDHDGLSGRWRWKFEGGTPEGILTEDEPVRAFGPEGNVVILADRTAAVLYNSVGQRIDEIKGRFRMAEVSRDGKTILLNDLDNPRFVTIQYKGTEKGVDAGANVLGMRVSPNGKHAVVWYVRGWMRELDPKNGRFKRWFRLPETDDAFVSSCYVDNSGRLVAGLLVRSAPGQPYDTGHLMVAKDGRVLAHGAHPIGAVSSAVPAVQPVSQDLFSVRDLEGVSVYKLRR